jgi:hypothetical protein
MHRTLSRVHRLLVALLLLAAPGFADVTRFDLSGIATDVTGGVLPGVTVNLTNTDTGFTRSTVTDEAGRYSFNAMPPTGKWTLEAELPGFSSQKREGLEFQANTRPVINFQLSVGALTEVMTVQASTPLVRTRESELSSIMDAKQVDALPTNGRNFLTLLQTSGSVVPTGSGSSALSVNGQGTRMANFLADGVSMTGREIRTLNGEFGGGNGLSLDVVKELQVITNGFKAETGQTGAGTISGRYMIGRASRTTCPATPMIHAAVSQGAGVRTSPPIFTGMTAPGPRSMSSGAPSGPMMTMLAKTFSMMAWSSRESSMFIFWKRATLPSMTPLPNGLSGMR